MLIGLINVKIFIPGCHSLKDKRSVVKSLINRLQNKFNVSVAEIGAQEKWQTAIIAMAVVGNESKIINQQLSCIITFLETNTQFELIDIKTEMI